MSVAACQADSLHWHRRLHSLQEARWCTILWRPETSQRFLRMAERDSVRASLQVLPQAIVEEEEEEEEEAAAPAPARPSPARRAGQQVGRAAFPLMAPLYEPAPDDPTHALPAAPGEIHPIFAL